MEVEFVTDDGDRRLSRGAQAEEDRLRGAISDLTDLDVRRKPRPHRFTVLWVVLFLFAVGLLLLLINRPAPSASPSVSLGASITESAIADQGGATGGPIDSADPIDSAEGSIDSTAGPLSGTWAMYWTGDSQSESQAFTITFTGADTGTLEILNDDTESATTFEVEGDQVTFEFTRAFDVPNGEWPEKSVFVGVLQGRNEMSGEWSRQGWECRPEPDAGCSYDDEWSRFPSRLIRISE